MICDPVQRLLLKAVLEDALDLRLAPLLDCPGCEYWMERGPCPRHQAGRQIWVSYLELSAHLEEASATQGWALRTRQVEVITRAIPEALTRRSGAPAGLDAGLRAAYSILADQLELVAV